MRRPVVAFCVKMHRAPRLVRQVILHVPSVCQSVFLRSNLLSLSLISVSIGDIFLVELLLVKCIPCIGDVDQYEGNEKTDNSHRA